MGYTRKTAVDRGTRARIASAQKAAAPFADQADIILVVGGDGLLLHASASWWEIFGDSSSDWIGRPLLDQSLSRRIGGIGRQLLSAHLEALHAGEPVEPIGFGWEHPKLGWRYYEGRGYLAEHAPGAMLLLHDATGRWQRLVALVESERRFGTVADATHGIVSETDFHSGRFTYLSRAVEDVLGYSPQELVGTEALALHHRDGVETFFEAVRDGGKTGEPFRLPAHRLRHKDGSWVWFEAVGVRYQQPGSGDRVIGVARDISARLESENARKAIEARLQRSQKLESLGVLAGGIAHDFNNLLTPVVGAVDMLLEDLPPDSPIRDRIETIGVAAEHARVLTDQMLAYAGETALVYKSVELGVIVLRMSRLIESMATRTATISFQLAEGVPPIDADAGQIGQVVLNLVSNASEALPPEGGRIEVRTGVLEADRTLLDRCHLGESLEVGRYVYLEVEDEGQGIEDDALDRILDPFFTTKFTGRGLGLAVVLGVIRRHDGCIRIESRPGGGTTFQVLLPASCEAVAPEREQVAPEASDRSAALGAVLVVDDDQGARDLTTTLLERAGFTVYSASDGPGALESFSRHRDEIRGVVLDGTMPGMSGANVFDAIRAIDPEARILLISGYARERDAEALFERGLVGFLHKPFDAVQLVSEVQRMLAGSQSDPQ